MSLILEALRKSEAQRQLGRVPGVLAPMPPARRYRLTRTFVWIAWIALAFAGGWLAWLRPMPSASDRGRQSQPVSASPAPPAVLAERRIGIPPERSSDAVAGADAPAPVRSDSVSTPISTPISTPSAPAAPASTSDASPIAPTDPLPSPADLLPGERAALPPLRMSMHVYADQPGARFVIIDGKRVGEGALLADGVVLRTIDRDGIVIDAHGRTVRVSRP